MKPASLTTAHLPGHIRRIAVPMSIGFFFNTMYNVVDWYYAGTVSTSALAAMALSFPVFFVIIALSEGIARGASALIANAVGEGDTEKEAAISGQVFSLGLICAVLLTTLGLSFARPLFILLGAEGEYLETAVQYISPLFIGAVFFLLTSMSNSILLAHGDSKSYGRVLIAGFFLNLVLDPWFLHGGLGLPAMGVAGIAWATVVIQAVGGLVLFSTVLRRGHVTLRCTKHLAPNLRVYGEILKQGIPTAFNMMSIALGFFVTTYFLQHYGKASVAAFGVGTRIEQIALLPTIGLSAAIVSVVGQNNGAGELGRVREAVQLCLKYGFFLIATASVLMFALARPLVDLFTDDPQVIEIGVDYVRIVTFIQWAYVMTFLHTGFLQAIKRPMYGFVESVIRKLVLPVGVFSLVVLAWKLDLTGFWISMCAINVVMTVVTILYVQAVLRKLVPR